MRNVGHFVFISLSDKNSRVAALGLLRSVLRNRQPNTVSESGCAPVFMSTGCYFVNAGGLYGTCPYGWPRDILRHLCDKCEFGWTAFTLCIYVYIYIYICWFNFDALAQGNAYKPTKEPMNYRGPGGDRTHDLQTEATPPAASCPARTLHATEIAPKNATPMTCPWLHWTTDNLSGMYMVSISTPVCVNFELRPGAGDIHICWFNFDALAQGNAYKPTKEPICIYIYIM